MSDDTVDHRLAIYGTLAPGKANHAQISSLKGDWRKGEIRGTLAQQGWGAAFGWPGLILDPIGPTLPIDLFVSADLPSHWARLDAFEGEEFRRTLTTVVTEDGELTAWVYALA